MTSVLDASALLAYLRDEPGAETVAEAVAEGTTISTVNLAEVLSRVADRGGDPAGVLQQMTAEGLIDGAVSVEPFKLVDALASAGLRTSTRGAGLSLGDRVCVALARRLGVPALTADSAWLGLDVGIELRQIR